MSKTITVFGATGNQGGSVVKEILANPELSKTYKIRAVTRNVSKPAAKALKEQGVEVVAGDMNDPGSIANAIKGSNVVFGVTNFWETMNPDDEIRQGKAIVDACKEANVERLIFSSLVNVSKETHGKFTNVKHFDSKAEVEAYARSVGVSGTYFMPAVFMPTFFGNFKKGEDGDYTYATPLDPDKTMVPLIDPGEDAGLWVAAILLNLSSTLNKRVAAAGDYITPNEMVKTVESVSGKKATLVPITWEQFRSFLPPPIASEITANFQLIENPGYYVGEDPDTIQQSLELISKSGLRKPRTWKDFVKAHLSSP